MPQPDNNAPPAFSPGASPPLILAFLAIGLFGLSMVGVFGWRRYQYSRLVAPTWPELHSVDSDVGPRPKLWDMWTANAKPSLGGTKEQEMGWDAIMPVAVMPIPTSSNHPGSVDAGTGTSAGTASRTRLPITSIPVRYYQWTRRPEPFPATNTNPTIAQGKAAAQPESDPHDEGRLQVAVAIAMPSRRAMPMPRDTREQEGDGSGSGTGPKTDDTFEYTLGVYECAWKHDNG